MSQSNPASDSAGVNAESEVVDLCRDLIRIDTSNYGDHSGPGERAAAEYVAEKLAEVGLEPKIIESHKGRASTGTPTSYRRTPTTGRITPSPGRSSTTASGAAARST